MNTIVLATSNPHKVAELKKPLIQHGFDVRLQTEFFKEQVEEDGLSFIENALKKARYASEKTGLPAIADDSGLQVAYLNGAPGIYSARYAASDSGENASDADNMHKLLQALEGMPYKQRQASYFCAVVYVKNATDPTPLIGIGEWHGEILMEVRTTYGIGYDPIMWIPSEVRSASEITQERKSQISHRAKALRSVLSQLDERAVGNHKG
jgi:XTP/dITP diphosphohydrolase